MNRKAGMLTTKPFLHQPVMLSEVLENLTPAPGKTMVDVTVGGGGHAAAMLERMANAGMLIGIDRDEDAVRAARQRLCSGEGQVFVEQAHMSRLGDVLARLGVDGVDGILADLGVSSFQLDEASRGFSIRNDGPLDMRMDTHGAMSARELLREHDVADIERIIREYGEERYARSIAAAIAGKDIETTGELVRMIERSVPAKARRQRIHPATRTFQALRIAVNDELSELRSFLMTAPRFLNPGGTLVIISYHSLEDRPVKHSFREWAAGESYVLPRRKAIRPTEEEVSQNARARSAKLRSLKRMESDEA